MFFQMVLALCIYFSSAVSIVLFPFSMLFSGDIGTENSFICYMYSVSIFVPFVAVFFAFFASSYSFVFPYSQSVPLSLSFCSLDWP